MIKQFEGVNESYGGTKFEPVPEGSYVAKINSVKLDKTDFGEVLILGVDITEGELAGYYSKRFVAESAADPAAKYKGNYRVNVPTGDGSERDGWNVAKFNRMLGAVAASNAGFKWNWNEQALVGKAVGLVYRVREWEFNGNSGLTTEIGMLCSVEDARKNKIKLKPRMLKHDAPALAGFTATTEEVPF